MVTFKSTHPLLFFCICCVFIACKTNIKEPKTSRKNSVIFNDTISLNENLKKISLEFVNMYKLNNNVIEVDIDKKEFNQTYISLTCRGLSYFLVKKHKPLLTYELKDNSFFVFTGAEGQFQLSFNTLKYANRRQEKCDSAIKVCYLLEGSKIIKEENCSYPVPFSNMPAALPPPINNKQ